MENQIVTAEQFGIEPSKANELIGNLPQITSERDVLESQYNDIIKMDIDDEETAKMARELRLKIRDNRTKGLVVWHKTTKEVFLRAGQFIDAVKKREESVNNRMEDALEQIEKHAEIKEQERLDELEVFRLVELAPYSEFVPFGANIRSISDEDFQKLFNGAKLQFEAKIEAERKAEQARIEAEKKAEEQRIAREKAEAEERERIRKENERLKKEAEAREAELAKERKRIEVEREAERKAAEAKQKAIEEAARVEREKAAAEARKEAEARAKVEAELKAKREAEEKAESDRIAAIEVEKMKGDKDKIHDLILDLSSLKSKYEFKSEKANKMYEQVGLLLDKVINHIQQ
jgi:hypothetical protein